MPKFVNRINDNLRNKLFRTLQPLIIKQMFVGYKLILEKIDSLSIDEYIFNYNSTLKELECGCYDEDFTAFNDYVKQIGEFKIIRKE